MNAAERREWSAELKVCRSSCRIPHSAIRNRFVVALASLCVLLLWQPAGALVEQLYSLRQVMDESTIICEGVISQVDEKGLTFTADIKSTLKGKCPYKQLKGNVGVGQAWHPQVFMKQLKVGEPVIFFYKAEDGNLPCLGYTNGMFFQLYGETNAEFWRFTHVELRMNRTFNGTTPELLAALRDVLAGKQEPPPPNEKLLPFTREQLNSSARIAPEVYEPPEQVDGFEASPLWLAETWGNPAQVHIVSSTDSDPAAEEPSSGLLGEYFQMREDLSDFPDVGLREPDVTRIDPQIDIKESERPLPGTTFTKNVYARWKGLIRIPTEGKYKFVTESDDGSRLRIDGRQVVDNAGVHNMEDKDAKVWLKPGQHQLELDYFQFEGSSGCRMLWQPPDADTEIIPEKVLSHRLRGPRGEILRIGYAPGDKDKLAVSRLMEEDFAQAQRLLFEARNQSARPVKLAIAINTAGETNYFESPLIELPPNCWKHDLQVDLAAKNFKCPASQWKHTAPIADRGHVVKICILIYDAPDSGALFIDRMRLDRGNLFVRSLPLDKPANALPVSGSPANAAARQGGVLWTDYDASGSLSAFVCSPSGNKLYQQRGGEFVDVTAAVGLSGGSDSAAWADYDGDGWPDLATSAPALWHNQRGTFKEATPLLTLPAGVAPASVPAGRDAGTTAVGWLDATGNGYPSLLLAAGERGIFLFRGNGAGRFKEESAAWGLGQAIPGNGRGRFMSLMDFDGDGFTDCLYCRARGVLLRNDEGKTFTAVAGSRLNFDNEYTIGAAWGDFDNDGNIDVFIPQAGGKSKLMRNNGDGTFSSVIETSDGLQNLPGTPRAAAWGDVNMDGNLDLAIAFADGPVRLYLGDGKGKFSRGISLASYVCALNATGLAFADYDGDGDLDLLISGEKCAGVLVNGCPRTDRVPLKVRFPISTCPGAAVRLYDKVDRPLGVRQLGLVSGWGSQEPLEAIFYVSPGTYKISAFLTNSEVRQKAAVIDEKGLIWNVPPKN
ncbi:MAG TPA: FG-GAP-like repeat-containing protein [Planctomycetota bacterium]|jgi:hypothetical protein